jgi:hypothetical protein
MSAPVAIANALNAVFARFGVSALYTPPGRSPPAGGALTVSLLWCRQDDRPWSGVSAAGLVAELRVSEVSSIEEGGVVSVTGAAYRVQSATQSDHDRRLWRIEVEQE